MDFKIADIDAESSCISLATLSIILLVAIVGVVADHIKLLHLVSQGCEL
jgi:hypothetical protein